MMNWAQRHLNFTLILGIIIAPFLTFWLCFGLINLIALFAPGIAAIMVPTTGLLCIVSIVMVVQWYLAKKKAQPK